MTVTYQGKTYYVNLQSSSTVDSISAGVYLSPTPNSFDASALAISISANPGTAAEYQGYLNAAGVVKNAIDNTTTVAGCLTLTGAAFCAVATLDTGGLAYVACDAVWKYADVGAAACLRGVAGMIADQWVNQEYGSGNYAASFAGKMLIAEKSFTGLFESVFSVVTDPSFNPVLSPTVAPPVTPPVAPPPPAPPTLPWAGGWSCDSTEGGENYHNVLNISSGSDSGPIGTLQSTATISDEVAGQTCPIGITFFYDLVATPGGPNFSNVNVTANFRSGAFTYNPCGLQNNGITSGNIYYQATVSSSSSLTFRNTTDGVELQFTRGGSVSINGEIVRRKWYRVSHQTPINTGGPDSSGSGGD